MTKIAMTAALLWAAMTANSAVQTPAPPPLSPESETTFLQAVRRLADPATDVVQRDKTLVIGGNQVANTRDNFVGNEDIVHPREDLVMKGGVVPVR